MDTPDKTTQFSPSSFLNKFEDSPVFNYINTLSPIKPFSLGHNTPFHLFNLSSPQNLQTPTNPKESKIPRGSHVIDVQNESECKANASVALEQADLHTEKVDKINRELSVRETDESSKLASDFPRSLKYEYGDPENNLVYSDAVKPRRGSNMAGTELFPLKTIENNYNEAICSFDNDMGVHNIHTEQNKEIYHNESNDRNVDSRMLSFVSAVLQPPDEHTIDPQNAESGNPIYFENYDLEVPLNKSGEIENSNERIQLPAGNPNAVLSEVVHYVRTEADDKDSPVFNYINTLSPIKPFSLGHNTPFHLFNLSSPQNLQTPPTNPKESKIPRGSHVIDVQNESECKANASVALEQADLHTEKVDKINRELSVRETDESSKLASDFPRSLKYEYGDPENNLVYSDAVKPRRGSNMAGTELFPLKTIENNYNEAICSFDNDMGVHNIHTEQNKEIYHNESNDRNVDSRMLSFVSAVLQPPDEHTIDPQNAESGNPIYFENYDLEVPLNKSGEIENSNERIQLPAGNPNAVLSEEVVHYVRTEADDKQQETTRRRCLVYEMSGSHYRKLLADSTSNSPTQLPASSNTSNNKNAMGSRPVGNRFSSALPSIGLHLNALAASAKNKIIVKRQTLTCRRQLINSPCKTPSLDSIVSASKSLKSQKAPEAVEQVTDKQNDEAQVSGNVPENSSFGEGMEFPPSSPKKKRKKSEDDGEPDSCKRCNCKRSKCLKLYCECFAAGLYCVEPCNCQDCFNKPAHEETVLETRRQIESRNPLAFAPKVIRCSDTPNNVEEVNKTPASARHKRGCNCKKSGCLKKYCECFQGGVGCSLSCRCEGCKNTFGQKEGTESFIFQEPQLLQNALDAISRDDEENHDQVTPDPSKKARQLVQQPFHFGGKTPHLPARPSGSFLQSCTTQNISESDQTNFEEDIKPEFGENGDAFEALKGDYSLPTTCVKSSSPNCKRISPPHCYLDKSPGWRSCRKLILRSIPTFSPDQEGTDLPEKH